MPLDDVLHAITQLRDVAGILAVRDMVTTVRCDRRTRDGTMQRVTIEISFRTPSFASRYEIQAKAGRTTATGKANSLDEALWSVDWRSLDSG